MAKQTLRNGATILDKRETPGGVRYSLRSDGKVLRQFRLDGRLGSANIYTGFKTNDFGRLKTLFESLCERLGATEVM